MIFKNQRKGSILSNKIFETKKSLYGILSVQELRIPDIQKIYEIFCLLNTGGDLR
ncbi:MAG: hypothetical protein AABX54_04275 [Nanoarchaeota archaeon]